MIKNMTIKYLYIVLISFLFQSGTSQNSFSEEELQNFVYVYMSFKKEKKRNSMIDKKYFDSHKVSQKRYREIADAALTNEPVVLSLNEEQLMQDLKNQNEFVSKANNVLLEKLCFENNFSTTQYSAILDRYKTDIQFQRSLKPYFDTYIKRIK